MLSGEPVVFAIGSFGSFLFLVLHGGRPHHKIEGFTLLVDVIALSPVKLMLLAFNLGGLTEQRSLDLLLSGEGHITGGIVDPFDLDRLVVLEEVHDLLLAEKVHSENVNSILSHFHAFSQHGFVLLIAKMH